MIRKFPINSTRLPFEGFWGGVTLLYFDIKHPNSCIQRKHHWRDSQTHRKMNSRRGTPKRYLLPNRKKWSSYHSPRKNETAPTTTLLHILAHTNDQVLLGTCWGDVEGMSWHLQTTSNQTAGKATMLSICSSSWYSPVDNSKALTVARSLVEQFIFHGWSMAYAPYISATQPGCIPELFQTRLVQVAETWNISPSSQCKIAVSSIVSHLSNLSAQCHHILVVGDDSLID